MENINQWHNETIGNKAVQALKKNGFNALYVEKAEEAAKYVLEQVNSGDKVGVGGSDTINTLKVHDKIREIGAEIFDHNLEGLTAEEKLTARRTQLISDLFLCSSNAITLNGELVNVDGVGNRVAAMTFGPKKVVIVAGVNKICKDEEAAFERIKMVAAPKNAKRLSTGTPCNEVGLCMDCKNEKRICKSYSVMKRKPSLTDITVVIVGEKLGY